MDNVKTWGEAITFSLINVGQKMVDFLPTLLGAVLVLVAGWIMAVTLGRLVEKMVSELGVDSAMKKMGLSGKTSKGGLNLNVASFIGGLFLPPNRILGKVPPINCRTGVLIYQGCFI